MRAKQDACALSKPFSLLVKSAVLCLRRADLAAVSGNVEEQRRRLEDFVHQVRNVIPQHQQYERRKGDEHVRDLDAKVDSALAQLRVMDDAEGAQDSSTESSVTYDDDGRTAGRNAISLEARKRAALRLKHEEQDLHSTKDIADLQSQIGSLNEKVEKVISGSLEMAEGFTVFRTEMEDALANKSNDYSDLVGKLTEITNKIGVMEQQASAEIKTTQLHSHCKMHGADGEDEPDLQLSNEMLIPIKDQRFCESYLVSDKNPLHTELSDACFFTLQLRHQQISLIQTTIFQMQSRFSQKIGACEDNFKSFCTEMDSKLKEMDTKLSIFWNQNTACERKNSRDYPVNGDVTALEDRLLEMETKMSMMKAELDFLKKDRAATPTGRMGQAPQDFEFLKRQEHENGDEKDKGQRSNSAPPIFARTGQGLESKFDCLVDNVRALKHENEQLNLRLCKSEYTTKWLTRAIDNILDGDHEDTAAAEDQGASQRQGKAGRAQERACSRDGAPDRSKLVDDGEPDKKHSSSERRLLSESIHSSTAYLASVSESESKSKRLFERVNDVEARCRQLGDAVDFQNDRCKKDVSSSLCLAKERDEPSAAGTSANACQYSSQVSAPAQEKWEIATAHLKTIVQQAEAELKRLEATNEKAAREWEEYMANKREEEDGGRQQQSGEKKQVESSSAAAAAAEMAVQAANAAAEAVKRAWARAEETSKIAEKASSIATGARQQVEPIVARLDSLESSQRSIEAIAVVAAKRAEVVENAFCRTLSSIASTRGRSRKVGAKSAEKGAVSLRVPALHSSYAYKRHPSQTKPFENTLKATREIAASAEAKCEAMLSRLSRSRSDAPLFPNSEAKNPASNKCGY